MGAEDGGPYEYQQIVSKNKHSRGSAANQVFPVSGESIWGLGELLQSYSVTCTFKASTPSVKLLLISEKVKNSALLYPYPFL